MTTSLNTAVNARILASIRQLISRRLCTQNDFPKQIEAYQTQELTVLLRMLEFVETRLLTSEHSLKFIGGYTDQIAGCDGVNTLAFGVLANKDFKNNSWVARIFLTKTPHIAFPKRIFNPAAAGRVQQSPNGHSFSPLEFEPLCNNPSHYICADYLR